MGLGWASKQLVAHVKGNLHMGMDKTYLISVVTQCLPYIGYPRALQALDAIDIGVKEFEGEAE